jgi:histidinol-phosphate aminotransferase
LKYGPVRLSIAVSCDPEDLAAPGVRGLSPYQPGKPESELRRELGLDFIVKLASNENPLGPSPLARQAAAQTLAAVARYPDGNGFVLKQALAEHFRLDPAMVTLGNGSNDVLDLLARAFVTPANEVVFSRHAFAVYALAAQAIGATARVAPPNPPLSEQPYGHDLGAMASLVGPKTRLVFLANPNNPTGTWLSPAALESFVAQLPDHVIVVIDEAYAEYAYSVEESSAISWLRRYPNLVVTRTFSKAYGLAGLRVGVALSHPGIAELLNRVRQPFNVNLLGQTAAVAALQDGAHLERSVSLNDREMKRLQAEFETLGLETIPSAGNFLCVDFHREATPVYEAMLSRGVIVRPIGGYAMPNHLRITVGTPDENARLIEVLTEVLRT